MELATSQPPLQLLARVFQYLLNKAPNMIRRARKWRTTRRMMRSTLEDLSPLLRQDIEKLFIEMEEEEGDVVPESAKLCFCNSLSPSACRHKFQRYVNVVMNTQMAKAVKDTLSKMRDTLAVLRKHNSEQKKDTSGPQVKGDIKKTELFTVVGLDVLEDKPIMKECLMDLALFPRAQGISVAALIDMWAELYQRDDDGKDAMTIVSEFSSRNLTDLVVTRYKYNDPFSYFIF